MIINKRLECLKPMCSKVALRVALTGVHYNKKLDCFEATNSVVLSRYFPSKEWKDEDYDLDKIHYGDSDLEDCILPPDIFDVTKAAKKDKTRPSFDENIRLNLDTESDRVIAVTNAITTPQSFMLRPIQAKYPDVDSILNQDCITVRKSFNVKQFKLLLQSIEKVANKVTGNFYIDVPISDKPATINVENTNTAEKMISMIMPTSQAKEDAKERGEYDTFLNTKFYYKISYTDNSGKMLHKSNMYDAKTSAMSGAKDFVRDCVNNKWHVHSVSINEVINHEQTIDTINAIDVAHEMAIKEDEERSISDKQKEAEADALNELTDGPGSSDDAVKQIETCAKADEESYENEAHKANAQAEIEAESEPVVIKYRAKVFPKGKEMFYTTIDHETFKSDETRFKLLKEYDIIKHMLELGYSRDDLIRVETFNANTGDDEQEFRFSDVKVAEVENFDITTTIMLMGTLASSGSEKRCHAFRTTKLFRQVHDKLVEHAQAQGFDFDKPIYAFDHKHQYHATDVIIRDEHTYLVNKGSDMFTEEDDGDDKIYCEVCGDKEAIDGEVCADCKAKEDILKDLDDIDSILDGMIDDE